jgi:hypothetical protein
MLLLTMLDATKALSPFNAENRFMVSQKSKFGMTFLKQGGDMFSLLWKLKIARGCLQKSYVGSVTTKNGMTAVWQNSRNVCFSAAAVAFTICLSAV